MRLGLTSRCSFAFAPGVDGLFVQAVSVVYVAAQSNFFGKGLMCINPSEYVSSSANIGIRVTSIDLYH